MFSAIRNRVVDANGDTTLLLKIHSKPRELCLIFVNRNTTDSVVIVLFKVSVFFLFTVSEYLALWDPFHQVSPGKELLTESECHMQ